MSASLEDAQRCPKCQQPGEVRSTRTVNKNKVLNVYCCNERCEWYNTPWLVQVNPDGTVPEPKDHSGEAKMYVGFEGHDQLARDIRRAVELDNARTEIRNPRG